MTREGQSARMSRRALLSGAALAGGALAVPAGARQVFAAPALVRSGQPVLTHGVQSGDVGHSAGTVWTRADRPSRMLVEVSADPDFRRARRIRGPVLTPEHDFTGKTILTGLPDGRDIHYRIRAVDLHDNSLAGEPVVGRFRTVARAPRDLSFVWSGDVAGQGWGIDRDRGGYRTFEAMRRLDPDFFLCNGDNIYADNPIQPTVTLPDGNIWHNVTTEAKSKVAETLQEFRGAFQYNLLDDNLRRLHAEVAQVQQWDDHEVHNNWYPGEILDDDAYTEKRIDVLAARSRQAWHEYMPITPKYDADGRVYRVLRYGPLLDVFVLDMRQYKDPNNADDQSTDDGGLLGHRQAAWLKRELAASRATWKVISNDLPLGLVVHDTTTTYEAAAQDDPGRPLGREIQIADILSSIKRHDIRNVVWLTTDVHYTAAQYFQPENAAFADFLPFWQFVSGPAHAGGFQAPAMDATFGGRTVFSKQPPVQNASPATEYQFFGQVTIDAATRQFTVRLRDNSGTDLWSTTLDPAAR